MTNRRSGFQEPIWFGWRGFPGGKHVFFRLKVVASGSKKGNIFEPLKEAPQNWTQQHIYMCCRVNSHVKAAWAQKSHSPSRAEQQLKLKSWPCTPQNSHIKLGQVFNLIFHIFVIFQGRKMSENPVFQEIQVSCPNGPWPQKTLTCITASLLSAPSLLTKSYFQQLGGPKIKVRKQKRNKQNQMKPNKKKDKTWTTTTTKQNKNMSHKQHSKNKGTK